MHRLRFNLILVFLLWFGILFSQKEKINLERTLGLAEGLSTRWTQCVTEDYNKLIWVGTNKGVSRFDGYNFKNFSKANSNLRNDGVEVILRDSQGFLWTMDLGTSGDFSNQDYRRYALYRPIMVDIIDPVSLDIMPFNQHFASAPFKEDEIRIVKETERGIWIGTTDRRYFLYNDGFRSIFNGAHLERYHYIIPRDEQSYWADIDGAIHILDLDGVVIDEIIIPDDLTFVDAKTLGASVWLAYVDADGSSTHIYRISMGNNLEEISNSDFQIIEDRRSSISLQVIDISDDQYLLRIHDQSLMIHENHISDWVHLNGKNINTTHWYKDSYANLWYVNEDGVKVWHSKPNNFRSYLHNSSDPIETRVIYSLDSSKLLVGSYEGIYEVDRNKDNDEPKLLFDGVAVALEIIRYNDEILYTTGHRQGITRLSISQPDISKLTRLSENTVLASTTLIKDPHAETIWMGSSSGLMKYDINNESLTVNLEINKDSILGNAEVTDFYYDSNGLWVATYDGLFFTNPDSAVIKGYHKETDFPFSRLQHIYDDGTHFWLATNGKGLIKWNPQNEEYQRLTLENGLSSDYIHATYEDKDGFLWMPSDNGLMRMDKRTHEIVTYTIADGLNSNEFNRFSHFQDTKGNLILGSVDGVIEFKPEEINRSLKFNHNIVCTKVDVYDRLNKNVKSHLNEFIVNKSINLDPSEAYINLEFTVTDFTKEDNYQFAYKIEGLDRDWKYTRSNNLEIGLLPYGDFKLLLKAQGQGGQFTSGSLIIDIHVERPFYKTMLFTLALIILGMILIYLGIQYRFSSLRKRNIYLHAEVKARTKDLQEVNRSKDKLVALLAHDLRGPISSFKDINKKVQYLISKNDWDTLDKMTSQIDDKINNLDQLIGNLIPWVMVQSKNAENTKSRFNLRSMVDQSIDQLSDSIIDKNITVANDTSYLYTVLADATAIEIIIRNLLSNAIKFSLPGGKIDISTSSDKNFIYLFINDEGVGMTEKTAAEIFSKYTSKPGTSGEKGHGLGLKLSKDLAVRNGGALQILSSRKEGTTVRLKLPQI